MQAVVGSVVSIAFYSMVLYAVYKIWQVSTEMAEIKELLRDIKRNTEDFPPAEASRPESQEAQIQRIVAEAARVPDEIIG